MHSRRCTRRRVKTVSAEHSEAPERNQAPASPPVHQLARPGSSALTRGGVLQLQRTLGNRAVGRLVARTRRDGENRTGLPDALKSGVERLSGVALDDVKVHYNSQEPARLRAYAYTRGAEIHVAPGEERHLPHEAWHVVQQAQGRVRPTAQLKGVALNEDHSLEREADVMGARAVQTEASEGANESDSDSFVKPARGAAVVQAAGKPAAKKRSMESRPAGLKNEISFAVDGTKFVHDPFDQTVTVIIPDGRGVQLTYEFDAPAAEDKKPKQQSSDDIYDEIEKERAPKPAHVVRTEVLSPMRVKALGFLDEKQGTFQETDAGKDARIKADHDKGEKKRKTWREDSPANQQSFDAYQAQLKEYAAKAAATPKGEKKPNPPPPPKDMPADPATTLCNSFPLAMSSEVGPAGDTGMLANFDPEPEGTKRGSWRTLATNPEGPKPGDIYSLGLPKDKKTIKHLGIFKSRRPGPKEKTEIWTVVDGGQGTYATRQQVLERTRFFHADTELLTTNLADAGQDPEDRSLRGWVDVEAHFAKKDEAVST